MSEVHRCLTRGPVRIDVRLLDAIEAVTRIGEAPGPSIVAPLQGRADEHEAAYRSPEDDEVLVAAVREAMDGCWLRLWEAHCVQRLRGWNRARRGGIVVDAYWLAAVANILDSLTLSCESECEETLAEWDRPRASDFAPWTAMIKSMIRSGECGECDWCVSLRLRDEANTILDAAGFYGGSRYEAYGKPWQSGAVAA